MKRFSLMGFGLLLGFIFQGKPMRAQPARTGTASYYHPKFEGRKTATGEVFSQKGLTAASNHYPLGTHLKVTNPSNGKSIVVRVNDRMAKNSTRVLDLTQRGARELCFIEKGLCKVLIEPLDARKPQKTADTLLLQEPDTLFNNN
ncbi:MAG: septal ring lytic transglycosylase RlpA family protein [Chitinophagaceae bacterium]|nr:septal ring lytic transglycosylase RlpA family protein [Chitinophagaceae bacterium]